VRLRVGPRPLGPGLATGRSGIGGHHEDDLVVLAHPPGCGIPAEVDGVEPGRGTVDGAVRSRARFRPFRVSDRTVGLMDIVIRAAHPSTRSSFWVTSSATAIVVTAATTGSRRDSTTSWRCRAGRSPGLTAGCGWRSAPHGGGRMMARSGFALAEVVDGNAHLAQVSVRLASRARGVGRLLIEAVCGWARDHAMDGGDAVHFFRRRRGTGPSTSTWGSSSSPRSAGRRACGPCSRAMPISAST
jgi:GNAT superfamily N-acetyltransferase